MYECVDKTLSSQALAKSSSSCIKGSQGVARSQEPWRLKLRAQIDMVQRWKAETF